MIGQRHDQRGQRFGKLMRIQRAVGDVHLFDAGDLRGGFGRGANAFTGDKDMHRRAQRGGGGDGLGGRIVEHGAVDFGENQGRHQITPTSFLSLETSSATEATFAPPVRAGGSVVFSTVRRGAGSTP